jgi:hypothetical protein
MGNGAGKIRASGAKKQGMNFLTQGEEAMEKPPFYIGLVGASLATYAGMCHRDEQEHNHQEAPITGLDEGCQIIRGSNTAMLQVGRAGGWGFGTHGIWISAKT